MSARRVFFTIEFRRKMSELPPAQRLEWLTSLTRRLEEPRSQSDGVLLQELHEVARGCRLGLVESVEKQLGPFDDRHLRALLEVERERFVRPSEIARSAEDVPLPLDEDGFATISAPHAYLLSYRLVRLGEGDTLVELGTGSGYGAALAAYIVGARGRVVSFEIDRHLAMWARELLNDDAYPNIRIVHEDAMASAPHWGAAKKVVVAFAVESLPADWLRAIPEGGMLIAPVGPRDRDQRLILASRREGVVTETDHGAVRYVRNRSGGDIPR